MTRLGCGVFAAVILSCSTSPTQTAAPAGGAGTSAGGATIGSGGSAAGTAAGATTTAGMSGGGVSAAGAAATAGTAGAAGVVGAGGSAGAAGAAGAAGTAGAGGSGGAAGAFAWPAGKTAAASLTYDDGLDAQLSHAIPLLDSKGIKATFFLSSFPGVDHDWALPNATSALSPRQQAWVAAAGTGHEIAGHTVNHPCVPAVNPGQAQGFRNADYDLARITAELDDTKVRIARVGATMPFTFAYPCYSDALGVGAPTGPMVTVLGMQLPQGTVFTDQVNSRFFAARGSKEGVADPATLDIHAVPYVPAGPRTTTDATPTLAQLTALVDMAIAQHGWVVFLFHGVAGDTLPTKCDNGLTYAPQTCIIDYLDTPTATHDGLVNYLAGKPEVWTTRFKDVAQHVAKQRGL